MSNVAVGAAGSLGTLNHQRNKRRDSSPAVYPLLSPIRLYHVCVGRQCCTITFLSHSSALVYDRLTSSPLHAKYMGGPIRAECAEAWGCVAGATLAHGV
jgi:hypothetical protein